MQRWQTTYLGMRELSREISAFEMRAFFIFAPPEGGAKVQLYCEDTSPMSAS